MPFGTLINSAIDITARAAGIPTPPRENFRPSFADREALFPNRNATGAWVSIDSTPHIPTHHYLHRDRSLRGVVNHMLNQYYMTAPPRCLHGTVGHFSKRFEMVKEFIRETEYVALPRVVYVDVEMVQNLTVEAEGLCFDDDGGPDDRSCSNGGTDSGYGSEEEDEMECDGGRGCEDDDDRDWYIEYDEEEEIAAAEQAWSKRLQTGIGFPVTLSEVSRWSYGISKGIGGTGPLLKL
ncbi:hypothetical protein BDV12DRAFT_203572 [Aspergillus spectabilis]